MSPIVFLPLACVPIVQPSVSTGWSACPQAGWSNTCIPADSSVWPGTAMCRHSFPSTQAVGQETYGREKLQILFTNLYTVIELPVFHRFCFPLVKRTVPWDWDGLWWYWWREHTWRWVSDSFSCFGFWTLSFTFFRGISQRLPLCIFMAQPSCTCVRGCWQPSGKLVTGGKRVLTAHWQIFYRMAEGIGSPLTNSSEGLLATFANSTYLSEGCQYPRI